MGPNPNCCDRCTQLGGCITCLFEHKAPAQMIDYQVLNDALAYYTLEGFDRIEAPWTVTRAVADITRPPGSTLWSVEEKKKVLVASGEQSFLYLYLKGFLPRGRFCTLTPCFRDESFDLTHTKYFMKVELIDTLNTDMNSLNWIVDQAHAFFASQLGSNAKLVVSVTGTQSYDIEYDGQELGSYGIRECSFLRWVYGTGVAEPRFSTVRRQVNGLSRRENPEG
jgi:hypothetical protein